jgi:hypothetical protein
MVKCDLDGLSSICDETLRVTNELGVVYRSAGQLMPVTEHLKIHAINIREREIDMYANVAMVLTEEEHHITLYGQRITTRMRCNRIWKLNGRMWKLHVSTSHALP